MNEYVWLFPIIFIFHNMEEIIGCTLHFGIHLAQAIIIKKYIPAVITRVICLPISVWIISKCLISISDSIIIIVICIVIGIAAVAINLRFAQKLIGWFTRKVGMNSKYSVY